MLYRVLYNDDVTRRIIPSLPIRDKEIIRRAIDERLTSDPTGLGKPLQYNLKGYRRLRVGNWRVIYRIEGTDVIICDIVDRRDAYKDW